MSDLNVTEGEWFVQRTGGIDGIHVLSYPKLDHQSCVARTESLADAYLIAQAKNMYEMLVNLHFNDYIADLSIDVEVSELLNACKPPKDRV